MGEIKIIKLLNGEELIGIELVETAQAKNLSEDFEFQKRSIDHLFLIRIPMRIVYEYDELKRPYVSLYDWIPASGDDLFAIERSKILTIVNSSKEIENLYYQLVLSRMGGDESGVETTEPLSKEGDIISNQELEARALKKMLDDMDFDEEDMQ